MSLTTLRQVPTAVVGALAGLALALVVVAPGALAADTTVGMADDAFQPQTVTVNVGDTVTWVNNEDRPHTVTAADGSFGSGTLELGGQFSQTFASPGTYGYYCQFHGAPGSGMSGTVIVEGAAAPVAPAPVVPATSGQEAAPASAASGALAPDAAMERPPQVGLLGVALFVTGMVSLGVVNVRAARTARMARTR